MANTVFMSKTGLIGGEATKLDSIDGAGLVDNDAAFVNVANVQYIYRLDADSAAAESSPNIIAPDTNPGDKRWILQNILSSAPVLGTPASGTLTNCTGLPIATGVSGLGANMAAWLADPTSAKLAATVTNETGSGALVFATSPTLVTPTIGTAYGTSLTLSGLTASLPVFSDGSKKLVSKSVADTLTALGMGSAAFEASLTGDQSNVIGGLGSYDLTGAIWTEIVKTGSCFSNGTFTAPAAGVYLFTVTIRFANIAADNDIQLSIMTTAGAYIISLSLPYAVSQSGVFAVSGSAIVTLAATNTAYIRIVSSSGSKVVDVIGGSRNTVFCGYRLK